MGAIVCFNRCWGCQFQEHPNEPHTWMDGEDIEHAEKQGEMTPPSTPEEWQALTESHPCNCHCNGRVASIVIEQ